MHNHLKKIADANIDDEWILKAFQVASELQEWIDDTEGMSISGVVTVEVSDGVIAVSVGHEGIWNSEFDGNDELTFENCLAVFIDEVKSWQPWLNKFESQRTPEQKGVVRLLTEAVGRSVMCTNGQIWTLCSIDGETARLQGPATIDTVGLIWGCVGSFSISSCKALFIGGKILSPGEARKLLTENAP